MTEGVLQNNPLKAVIKTSKIIDDKLEELYSRHINCSINLTAIKDKQEFYIKHYLDSIYYFDKYFKPKGKVADIGSGGGFPGLVLAIFYAEISVTLIESTGKKCRFLESTAKALGLTNVEVINARAENVTGYKFDVITARGVSTVKNVLEYTFHISKPSSRWVLYKGEKLALELTEAEKLMKTKEARFETIRIEEPFTRTYCIISR